MKGVIGLAWRLAEMPARIGHCQILEKLGEGGMGVAGTLQRGYAMAARALLSLVLTTLAAIGCQSETDEDRRETPAETRNLRGVVTVDNGGDWSLTVSWYLKSRLGVGDLNEAYRMVSSGEVVQPCPSDAWPSPEYPNIRKGTAVEIRDGEGKTVGVGRLENDRLVFEVVPDGCRFDFNVKVPVRDFYRVRVGNQDELSYSKADLDSRDWSLNITFK
jgi:hypothetical protein